MEKFICCGREFLNRFEYAGHIAHHNIIWHDEKVIQLKEMHKLRKESKKEIYDKNPKICPQCLKAILFEKKNNKFCSMSCGVSFTNSQRIVSENTKLKTSKTLKEKHKNNTTIKNNSGNVPWYEIDCSIGKVKVQGMFEVRVVHILEKLKQFNKILNWEYTFDRFQYINVENIQSTYIMDFKVFLNKNEFYYLEIKGREYPVDKLKWQSVIDLGFNLQIWYGDDIYKKEKELGIKHPKRNKYAKD